jgi:hypothetical protein
MFGRILGVACAVICACFAGPAAATVVFQQSGSAYNLETPFIDLPGQGVYVARLKSSHAVNFGGQGTYVEEWGYYFPPPPQDVSSALYRDNYRFYFGVGGGPSGTDTSFIFTIPRDRYNYFISTEFDEYLGVPAGTILVEQRTFNMPAVKIDAGDYGGPGGEFSYELTIERIGSVPEPATWAFMIVGFACVGGTMRRRVRAS